MKYSSESQMYPDVIEWLRKFLKERFKKAKIIVFDSSHKKLNRLISDNGLEGAFPAEWVSWDISVDVVGIAIDKETRLAFVECKNTPLTLRDLSQLIGYSVVAKPDFSFLLSPQGFSDSLIDLLKTYNRKDVLCYEAIEGRSAKSIVVAKWVKDAKSLDWSTIIAHDDGYSSITKS